MTPSIEQQIRRFETTLDPTVLNGGGSCAAAAYAALLLERADPESIERASAIVRAIIRLQVDDPTSPVHGQFPMVEAGEVGDLNAALFRMPALIRILELAPGKLADGLLADFDACVRRAVVATERRWDEERFDLNRDFKAYTNVFLLYIQALVLAGNHLADARLKRVALAQWQRWFNHIAYWGIDEISPIYADVDLEALTTIHRDTPDDRVRSEAGEVLEYLNGIYHATTHPILKLPVSGSFRNYRKFLSHADCQPRVVSQGEFGSEAVRAEYRARRFPITVRGRSTGQPFRYQCWQDANVAMGSMTGGNYFWQQIHCMVAVGESETERAVMFVPGQFTPTNGYVAQHESTALCVFNRRPNHLHRTQDPMPDDQVHAFQKQHGIGLSDGWAVHQDGAVNLIASAFGFEVRIQPFIIDDQAVLATALRPARHNDMGQEGFHRHPAEFAGYLFPDEAEWFGCVVTVAKAGQLSEASVVTCDRAQRVLTVSMDQPPLGVRLFDQPSGEVTEFYNDDWRATPLLASPAYTLWPGELTRRAAN